MMTSFYNLLKYAATGIASPDMTYYDRMRASTLMGGVVQTLTGIPPLTFKADGSPLISWSMKGNAQQTGTPTPDNPVMPEFVGVRTANLFDISLPKTDYAANVYQWTLSGLTPNAQYTCSSNFVQSGTTASIWFGGTSSGTNGVSAHSPKTMTANSNGEIIIYINHSYNNAYDQIVNKTTWVMMNTGSAALPYEPFGWAEKITCAGQTTPVYLGEVPTVRRVRKLVLDGTEAWQLWNGNYFSTVIDRKGAIATVLCTHFINSSSQGISYSVSSIAGLKIASAAVPFVSSVDELKAWLASQYAAGHPVTIWYVLANEQTGIVNEPLCKIGTYADELSSEDAGVSIPTVKGSNVLTVDTPIQPSEMTITFKG